MLQALSVLLLRPRPVCHLHSPVALFEDGMGGMGGMEVGPDGNVVIEISPDGSVVQVERGREFLAERCEFFREEGQRQPSRRGRWSSVNLDTARVNHTAKMNR
jgi:hypothetical protein